MLKTKLSPKEKRRLERLIRNIRVLANRPRLSTRNRFIRRRQLKAVLSILGVQEPNLILLVETSDIVTDIWPFKLYRLRKLINGRRPRQ